MDIQRLRRMVAEPDDSTYTDTDLQGYVSRYPLLDADGLDPLDEDWVPTYDLHAAAADVWEEKAAAVAADFNFAADGARFDRSQIHAQYQAQAQFHRMRRAAKTMTLIAWPEESNVDTMPWIGNLPELRD